MNTHLRLQSRQNAVTSQVMRATTVATLPHVAAPGRSHDPSPWLLPCVARHPQEGVYGLIQHPERRRQQHAQRPQHRARRGRWSHAAADGGAARSASLNDSSPGTRDGGEAGPKGLAPEVEEALEKVQQAMAQAELNVQAGRGRGGDVVRCVFPAGPLACPVPE